MKKSFAENCIRYISTATALILALAMLCCANFSASAKDLGSNLAITDTTLLLQDINTTTNTTPAKTKDLIASGAGVELESVGAYTGIIYVDTKNLTSSWSSVYLHYWGGDSSTWPGVTMTSVGDGIYSYDLSSKSGVTGCIFHNNSGTQTGDLTIPSSDNAMFVLNADGKSGTWSTYSGGSSTTSTWTLRGDSPIDWTTGTAMTTSGTNKVACSVELAKNTTYEFKLHDGSNWYGNTGTMTSDNCTGWTFSSSVGNNAKITTTNAGTYVFTLDTSTKKLSVTYPATYTVTFNANGHGTAPSSQNVSSGGTATEPTAPTASGYTFGGWYKESECTNAYDFSTAVTGNITLYAKWTANATSEVSEDILAILNGTKTQAYFGHPSSGWQTAIYIKSGSNSTNKTQIGTTKVSNVDCYYADFTLDSTTNLSSYAISDNSTWAGKSVGVNEIVVGGAFYYIYSSNDNENGKIDPTTAQTTLGATSFTVGTTDKLSVTTKATATTSSTGNALKYQYYIKNGTNYLRLGSTDITASTSDTTTEFDISTLPKGTYELITMLYDGHIYYVSDTTETDTFTISDSYTVTFNANGHGTDTETTVEPGSTVSAPTAPTAKGYTFGGWYKESTCENEYDFNTSVTGDLTLYAKWTANTYTVTFDYKDGTTTSTTKVVTYNEAYGELPSPTRENYTFGGWYLEEEFTNEVTSTTTVTTAANHTLYAKWTAKEYNITYVLNDGTINGTYATKYTYGVGATLPTDVTKDGYTFKGWYDNEGLTGDAVTSISATDSGDKTFYAKWEANKYQITYKSGSETLSGLEPSDYTYGVGVQTLPTPTKDGYRFVGWYESSSFTGSAVTSISNTATGTKTLYAKWIQKYIFLDVSGLDWFYNDGCKGVVFFNTDSVADTTTGYTVMTELFTDDSAYESRDGKTQQSKLVFAEVPINITDITKITFARHGARNHNITNFVYSNFTTNNCFKITGGGTNDTAVTGSWTTEDYTPVPINFTVGANGKVYLNNNYLDSNNKTVDIPITNGESTIYADKAATSLKVKATPSTGYEVNVLKVNGVDKASEITDKTVGGTVSVDTLGDTNTVEVTFKASANPIVTISTVENSSVTFIYLDENGDSHTVNNASGPYTVQFGSNITLEIIPDAGYYVKSVSGVTASVPAAGTITATATQVKSDLTVSYTLAENPKVTVECYDSKGTKLTSGVGITVDGGSVVDTTQTKTVLYNDSTGATFTASVEDSNKYVFLGYYDTSSAAGDKYATGSYDDYSVTVNDGEIKVYNVCSNRTIYAIFAQLYEVKFNYENLNTFTVNNKAVTSGGAVYVKEGASLSLATTFDEDYKMTNDCWAISPTGVGTFTPNASNATYVVGNEDVTITITPKIATYTGQGKWGSKTLRIDTSGVKSDSPWFAAKFATSSSGTTYTWVRFNKISDSSYECVVPDGYSYVRFCRMATKATTFTDTTTDDINATTAWNITDSFVPLGNSSSEYTLAFVDGDKSKITATEKTNN